MNEPADTEFTLSAALEMHRAGQLQAAAEIYRQLHERDRSNHDACYGLGTVLMQQGEFESALALLEQAVSAAPNVPEYVYNRACVMQRLGRNQQAANGFIRAARLAETDPLMLVEICSGLTALGHHYAAANILAAASQRVPRARIVWLAYACSLGKIRDYKAAIVAHEHALTIEPGCAADFLSYADLLFMAKRPAAARKALDRARELGTDDPRARYLEARCERFAGNRANERRLLAEAIELRPSYGDAWQFLLETTPDEELPSLILNCRQLADDQAAKPYDRIMLSYAAGRGLERLADYDAAFKQYESANQRQRSDALSRGIRYDKAGNEQFVERIRSQFAVRGSSATPTAPDVQPIFIVGMPRSGTTLVERILGGLDGVVTGGESEALELVAGQYYTALDRGQAKPIRELQPADWDELARHYWRLQTEPESRLTDKMPTNFRHVGMICSMFPDAPIVYVQRDPRDVALSIFSRRFADGHPYATEFDSLAHYYAVSQQLMSHWKSLYPERIVDIGYEELVKGRKAETRRLAEFCGLVWQPECLDFHERTDASYTFSELQVREPLNAKGIDRWRKYAEPLAPFVEACIAYGVHLRDN